MYKFLTSNTFSFFKENRLAFKGGAETAVIQQIEAEASTNKAAAAVLEDKLILWSKSKEKGEVGKFLEKVGANVDKQVPKHLAKATAEAEYKKYDNEKGEGKGKAASATLDAAWKTADADQFRIDKAAAVKKAQSELPEDASAADKTAAKQGAEKSVTKREAEWDSVVAGNLMPEGSPKILVDAVTAAGSRVAARAVCAKFDRDWGKAKEDFEASKKIEEHKTKLLENMETIALASVQEKQKQHFEAKKGIFIGRKAQELVPPLTKDEEAAILISGGPLALVAQKGARESARLQAANYLRGLLSNAELKVTEADINTELEGKYGQIKSDVQQKFVTQIHIPVEEREGEKEYSSDSLDKVKGKPASSEVRAYVEGLIDSAEDREKALKWTKARIASLPEGKRNDLAAVQAVLSTMHLEGKVEDGAWTSPGVNDEDVTSVVTPGEVDEEKGKEFITARAVLKNPQVATFLTQRMTKADDFFKGKPGYKPNMRAYRNMLISAIGQQNPEKIKMGALKALPQPSTFGAGAMKLDRMPEGARAATRMVPGTGSYALKLMTRLKQAKAEVGTIIQFTYTSGGRSEVYYGKYTGSNLTIWQVSPTKPKKRTPKKKGPNS